MVCNARVVEKAWYPTSGNLSANASQADVWLKMIKGTKDATHALEASSQQTARTVTTALLGGPFLLILALMRMATWIPETSLWTEVICVSAAS
jgi:hypothetical protein